MVLKIGKPKKGSLKNFNCAKFFLFFFFFAVPPGFFKLVFRALGAAKTSKPRIDLKRPARAKGGMEPKNRPGEVGAHSKFSHFGVFGEKKKNFGFFRP